MSGTNGNPTLSSFAELARDNPASSHLRDKGRGDRHSSLEKEKICP
jgi:hypothetical protein